MKISQVITAIKVGDILKRDENSDDKIKVVWLNPKDDKLRDNKGRVYLFVINSMIYKIGGSQAKGGIKSTIRSYTNCMRGKPSDRTFIIHKLLREQLDLGNSVEVYMITSEPVTSQITGLFGTTETITSPFKEMEYQCIMDYFKSEGNYPLWNFQESKTKYPQNYVEEYSDFIMKKTKKG